MNKYTTLFEQQSYRDALDYFMSSLNNEKLPVWDYVILTASNEAQAMAYEIQIAHRLKNGFLPERTHFAVIPDLHGKRVGSGGATLSCIRYVAEREGTLDGKRVLVIHSGGDSKRVPQYSAMGKLFSPVPRLLPGGRRSSLFDEFMIGMSTVAGRINEGMLICSGDVLLIFNALQIDFYGAGACALSIKESVQTGKSHGVFLGDDNGFVASFLHKQSVERLTELGAVDSCNNVNIDTGAVILCSDVLNNLYSLIDTEEKYHSFVNEKARLSFYADFLYPLAEASTLEQFYKETPEGTFTDELYSCRKALWEVLSPYRMKLIRLSPASFIHFGTTKELLSLMTDGMEKYRFLDWSGVIGCNLSPNDYAVSNSYISKRSQIGKGSYIEDSRIHKDSRVGNGCVVSGVTLTGDEVPDNTVLHGLKLSDGRFVCRMFGVDDNPKENKLFGKDIGEPLWTAKLYPVCDTMEQAVKETVSGNRTGELISLMDSFNKADVTAILPWQENLYEQVVAEAILEHIANAVPADKVKKMYPVIDRHTVKYLTDRAERLDINSLDDFKTLIRIYSYLFKLTDDRAYSDLCFEAICNATLSSAVATVKYNPCLKLCRDVVINLPVRVNWGGGWSDTPPYCMENGGTVLNAAITLDGRKPVEVTVRKTAAMTITLASTDIGTSCEFTDMRLLFDCKNPADPFALHKAALIACGIIPVDGGITVAELCERLGGGIYINTRVIDIPKGSGLGTSSILAGACVRALFMATDTYVNDDEIFSRVLCMEQLMSTSGGWQDQVGGIVRGIKMVSTSPGLTQNIVCTPLRISDTAMAELNSRFALIYTGQRRLARNLLRDVVCRYICNDKDSTDAHYNIQRLAVLMRFELEKGNIDGFARLLSEHWEESKRIDPGITNTCIDWIFSTIDDLIDGRMICGAGGGGFLQVILKKGVTKQLLRDRLSEVFRDSGVDVWNSEFVD